MTAVNVEKQREIVTVNLGQQRCPACGSTERWELVEAVEPPANNPELHVYCDCGQGELQIIVA